MARLLHDLSDALQFNYTLNVPRAADDRVPGEYDALSGNASGVLGMVIRSEADMSGLPLPSDPAAFAAVRYTDVILMDHFNILAPKMVDIDQPLLVFFLAFDWITWLLILLSLILIVSMDILLTKLLRSNFFKHHNRNRVSIENRIEIGSQTSIGSSIRTGDSHRRSVTGVGFSGNRDSRSSIHGQRRRPLFMNRIRSRSGTNRIKVS